MALAMRGECERCHVALARDGDAYICVFECTFCPCCAQQLRHACPNGGGERVRRPRARSADSA
jgi:hypothetical protein